MMCALSRAKYRVPPDIEGALAGQELGDAYAARPPYQRNDYIGWIERAKRPGTRTKRLIQMLDELRAGDRYMNMAWPGSRAGDSAQ